MGRAATLKLVLCFVWLSWSQSTPPFAQLTQSHHGITSTHWAHRFIHKTSIGLDVKSALMKSHDHIFENLLTLFRQLSRN